MPPKAKVTREAVVRAAVKVVQKRGAAALNARAVAGELGVSTQPVFSNYNSMGELRAEVLEKANALYQSYLTREMEAGEYPPYKASGIAYIRFAKEEKELFKLLFMRDRTAEELPESMEELRPLIALIQKNTGLSEEKATRFHISMWVYVHGIAAMTATAYLDLAWADIDEMLTDAYLGLRERYCGKGKRDGSD